MHARSLPFSVLKGERNFRWRGGEVSRVEALTDAVFALAMTLLILSAEVPKSYDDLVVMLKGVPAFACCFALYVLVWHYHYQFHRRFGLENGYTVLLNIVLLFLMLLYVYPAKFLFSALAGYFLFHEQPEMNGGLMLFYGAGVVGIFALFTLMNLHAYKHRAALELSEMEAHLTRATIREHLIHTAVGLTSIALALLGQGLLSGLIYVFVGPLQGLNGWFSGRTARMRGLEA